MILLYFGKIITTTHDLTMLYFVRRKTTPRGPYWLKIRLYKILLWWSHRKSNRIIVPTHTTAKEVAEYHPFTKKKLVVTYEAASVLPEVKGVKPADIGDEFIMYVGTAFPHKNLPALVSAFDILHQKRPKLHLVLVGKTEKYYKELKEESRHHSSFKKIVFTGYLPDEEVKWLFDHAKCYVFTSLSEGFGLPVLDAMANGTPVVSSNASVMPEVYGDAVHYCDAHDPKDVAEKVTEVLESTKLRERLVVTGKKQVKKYSWHHMAEETLTAYKAVLKD
jgi:glycosyltransferase involved in cell wall biosynthesis